MSPRPHQVVDVGSRPFEQLSDAELRVRLYESANSQREALYEIGASQRRVFLPEVLALAQLSVDTAVQVEAVWALGKCGYAPAAHRLVELASSGSMKLRQAALWGLGETGGAEAWEALVRAHDDSVNIDAHLGGVIGGALKKLRGLAVRAPRRIVARRLIPPETDNTEVLRAVRELEDLNSSTPWEVLVTAREHLLSLDAEYFARYMKYRSQRTAAIRAIESGDTFG